jgi:hypothetical protein
MSRSRKDLVTEPSDAPGAEKAGARRVVEDRPRSSKAHWIQRKRRTFGRTEKILRRNRRLWSRLHAKEGRRLDKLAVCEGFDQS